MPTIAGTILDSGNTPIASGILRVQLNAPIIDLTTEPSGYLTAIPHDFTITAGVLLDCELKESETDQISYTFAVFTKGTDYDYYYAGSGEFYGRNDDRPTHLYTDGKYYTGVSHADNSEALERIARERLDPIGDAFQAIVPNVDELDFSQLDRTGFATDRTPQTARQVASVLKSDPLFMNSLIDRIIVRDYDNATLYMRGNTVQVGGSSYQCLQDNVIGFPPAANPTKWKLLVSKGDPGGTGGNDAAFGAGWNGDLNAPSKNAVYDYIVASVALKSELTPLAPLSGPAFTGNPTRTTAPPASDRSSQIPTTEWVGNSFAPLDSPNLTGTPATTTASVSNNTDRIASTAWVTQKLADVFGLTLGSGKGNYKLSGGLFIQWGKATNGTGAGTETFSTPFPTQCLAVVVTPEANDTVTRFAHVQSVNATSFSYYRALNTGADSAVPIYYVAIGY